EAWKDAGGEGACRGMRAWRQYRGTASGGSGAGSSDWEGTRSRVRKGRGGRLGRIRGGGPYVFENGDRQAGNVCGGQENYRASGCDRAGDFREDDDGLGIGGSAGIAAAEDGDGISGGAVDERRSESCRRLE